MHESLKTDNKKENDERIRPSVALVSSVFPNAVGQSTTLFSKVLLEG